MLLEAVAEIYNACIANALLSEAVQCKSPDSSISGNSLRGSGIAKACSTVVPFTEHQSRKNCKTATTREFLDVQDVRQAPGSDMISGSSLPASLYIVRGTMGGEVRPEAASQRIVDATNASRMPRSMSWRDAASIVLRTVFSTTGTGDAAISDSSLVDLWSHVTTTCVAHADHA